MSTHDDELITTGQAAAILGTSARHVVQLADRGEIPYTLTGAHRRLRRADVEAFRGRASLSQGGPMTDDQLRSLWIGRLAAAQVALDPEGSLREARANIDRFLANQPAGANWLHEWLRIIERGPEPVMRMLTSTSPQARELRQNSPFSSFVRDEDRKRVIEAYRRTKKGRWPIAG